MVTPNVLLLSNLYDFSTDLVCLQLNTFGVPYLRLNRDQLGEYKIVFKPIDGLLLVEVEGSIYQVSSHNQLAVYYRAPTFLREIFHETVSAEDQLFKTQWAAFIRSLVLFENAKWVNSPVSTYKAEMKPIQLAYAARIGFKVPQTTITNFIENEYSFPTAAIKSIDTAIINKGEEEAFIYTTLLPTKELGGGHYSSPFFLQQGLLPKIDIRVTVVEDQATAVKIVSDEAIDIDWRKYKGQLCYELFELPLAIQEKCILLTKQLGLLFAAIDLVWHNSDFYFIELNPTGEWSWLQNNTGYNFDLEIAKSLTTHG